MARNILPASHFHEAEYKHRGSRSESEQHTVELLMFSNDDDADDDVDVSGCCTDGCFHCLTTRRASEHHLVGPAGK